MAMNPRLLRPLARFQAPSPSNPLLTGLMAFYKLSDVNDSSGNARHLTNSGATFDSGKIGNAAYFDGFSSMSTTSIPAFTGSDCTVAFWFNITSDDYEDMLIGCGIGDSAFYIVRVGGDVKASVSGTPELYCGFGNADNGSWHFCCVRRSADLLSIRVDTTSASDSGEFNPLNTPSPFSVGSNYDGSYLLLNGSIDAVGLWGRYLTDSEVNQLFNNGAGLELP